MQTILCRSSSLLSGLNIASIMRCALVLGTSWHHLFLLGGSEHLTSTSGSRLTGLRSENHMQKTEFKCEHCWALGSRPP